MTSVRFLNIVQDDDGVHVKFAGGHSISFSSLAHVRGWAHSIDDDPELLKKMIVAFLLRRSPDLTNINASRDKTFTFDLAAANPISVT